MAPTSSVDSLNAAQRKAVTHGEPLPGGKGVRAGPLLVVAGAGTGKTLTLAHRVAHLATHGVDPARILMLTFTRRAALEMRRRAQEIVRGELKDPMAPTGQSIVQRLSWSGTFHAMGSRLLRHYAKHLKIEPNFTVIDRSDSADVLDGLRQEQGLAKKEQRFPRKETCLAIYSHRVNTQKSLKHTLEQQYPWCVPFEDDLTKLFRAYVATKQRIAVLDYDDLLLYWHVMMSEPRLALSVGSHFDHVLVDEYQDTNKLQAEIIHAMKPDGAGVTVVGDDAQAIYSFRAAAVENILGFPDRFTPKAEIVTLAQNFRSTQGVLDAANALMAEAPRQFRKHLLSLRGKGARPRAVTVDDLAGQAEYVCAQVLKAREAQVPLRRQAVLVRTGSHTDLLEIELTKRKIPFVKYGGLRFLEAAHIKDVLAVLRWADNPRNTLAAFRVIQLLPGMGPENARKAIEHLEAAPGSIDALRAFTPPSTATLPWKRLVDLLASIGDPQKPWAGQVGLVRDWYRPHFERIYDQAHARLSDLDQLELLSGQYPSRERFITELTLDPPQATSDHAGTPVLDEDYLILSTVHSAKGLEWDNVYVLSVVDGSFPSEFATGKAELLEEERRLLYVAMTRARNELTIVLPLKFPVTAQPRQGDAHVYGSRSRFLSEKVRKCFDEASFQGAHAVETTLQEATHSSIDVTARLKEMW
jgi:DNA helicase-2/ATP-dependent DNA helicase PcrA